VDKHSSLGKSGHLDNRSKKRTDIFNFRMAAIAVAVIAIIGVMTFILANASTVTSTLWADSAVPKVLNEPDDKSVELGVKFRSKYAGKVTAIRFYKGSQNTGTHTGSLWDSSGHQLATTVFADESASGWQTAKLSQSVDIAANVTYIVSYHAPNGHYSTSEGYFGTTYRNGPLSANRDAGSSNANGVYTYSSTSAYPRAGYRSTNYWVDVVVETNLIAPSTGPAPPSTVSATQNGTNIIVGWNDGTSSGTISKYNIYRDGNLVASVDSKTLSYTDNSLTASTTYSYRIRTVDSQGILSALSVAATATYNPAPPSSSCPAGYSGTPPNCSIPTIPPVTTGSVPCALTLDAEACWQQNTGVQGGTGYTEAQIVAGQAGFTSKVGDLTITTPGTIIDHYYIQGCIAVKANDVTIKNSLIVAQNSCAGGLQNGGPNNAIVSGGLEDSTRGWVPARNLSLSYLTINGSGADGRGSTLDNVGFSNRNITADHLDVQGFAKGTYLLGDDSLTDSYFHNVSVNAGAAGIHLEPIFLWNSSNIVIDHNYFHSQTPEGVSSGGNTAAIFMKCDLANCGKNIVINNNYIRGDGGADIYGGSINGAPNYQGPDGYGLPFSITNNALDIAHSRNAINYWVTISTWINNYNADTKAQIRP